MIRGRFSRFYFHPVRNIEGSRVLFIPKITNSQTLLFNRALFEISFGFSDTRFPANGYLL